jgi:hypothetical protein
MMQRVRDGLAPDRADDLRERWPERHRTVRDGVAVRAQAAHDRPHCSWDRFAVNSSPFVIARTVLYEQVWAQSMPQLAKQFGVSYYALTKACRSADIPLPPQGYWLKLQHGRAVVGRPPLPPTPMGQSE